MARLTLATLAAQLEDLRVHSTRLEAENATLRSDIAALRTAQPAKAAAPQRPAYVRPAPSPEAEAAHSAYVQALIAAKAEAARTGRTVLVKRGA